MSNDFGDFIRDVLYDPDKCDLGKDSAKQKYITEIIGTEKTAFYVTVPAGQLSLLLEKLKKDGVGIGVGTVAIQTLDAFKPRFGRPGTKPGEVTKMLTPAEAAKAANKAALQGFKYEYAWIVFQSFQIFVY